MRFILSIVFLFMSNFLFAQSSRRIDSNNLDSFLCPRGYAALGHPYLPFDLKNEHTTVNNETLRGKVVFINFWFEGCHPCMAEMEALNELFQKFKDNKDFAFVTITWDNAETVERVKEKFSLLFDVFRASPEECHRLNFGCGYPTTFILDKTGIVKYRHHGGSNKTELAREFVMTTLLSEIKGLL